MMINDYQQKKDEALKIASRVLGKTPVQVGWHQDPTDIIHELATKAEQLQHDLEHLENLIVELRELNKSPLVLWIKKLFKK